MTPLIQKKRQKPNPEDLALSQLTESHSLTLSKRDVARLERAAKKAAPKPVKEPGLLARLLAEGTCREEPLMGKDLPHLRLWVGNALRGLIPARWHRQTA